MSALPKPTGKDLIDDEPDWASIGFDELQTRLENQRRKPTRLPVPAWAEVERGLPPGFMQPSRIVWNQVCLGYVPELATAWETLMRTNMAEMRSKVDRVFAISLFWIVTRTIDCPYCMGHCEMNWEVAGLPRSLIAERSALLAGDDWSSFPPAEQRAFAFARKLTRYPGTNLGRGRRDRQARLRRRAGPVCSHVRIALQLHDPHLQRLSAHARA